MVSGKPYISVNSATTKAEKAPKERQSRDVVGLVKLNANSMKMSALMMTKGQKPYSGKSLTLYRLPGRAADLRDLHVRCAATSEEAGKRAAKDKAENSKDGLYA